MPTSQALPGRRSRASTPCPHIGGVHELPLFITKPAIRRQPCSTISPIRHQQVTAVQEPCRLRRLRATNEVSTTDVYLHGIPTRKADDLHLRSAGPNCTHRRTCPSLAEPTPFSATGVTSSCSALKRYTATASARHRHNYVIGRGTETAAGPAHRYYRTAWYSLVSLMVNRCNWEPRGLPRLGGDNRR